VAEDQERKESHILLKFGGEYYLVNEWTKLADEPDTYIFYFRDTEKKRYRLKIKDAGIINSIDSINEAGEDILLIDDDYGEWKLYTPEQLPSEMKRLYLESKLEKQG